jgi:hypothetical protein
MMLMLRCRFRDKNKIWEGYLWRSQTFHYSDIANGVVNKQEVKDKELYSWNPTFYELMSLWRFQLLLQHIHFVNNDDAENNDHLRKVMQLFEAAAKFIQEHLSARVENFH